MIPHVIVLEPGLIIHKLYDGYWFFGRPTVEELRQDLRAVGGKKVQAGLGHHNARTRGCLKQERRKSSSIRTAKPMLKRSPNRTRSDAGVVTSAAPLNSVQEARGIKPGTPVSTTELNLTFVVMRSRISRIASSGRAEISKLS